jgi:hypothetical protein
MLKLLDTVFGFTAMGVAVLETWSVASRRLTRATLAGGDRSREATEESPGR